MNVISVDLSVVIIMLLVWSLYFVLKKSFFDPINRILADRERATSGTLREVQEKLALADEKTKKYQESIKAARLENYRVQEGFRIEAMKERSQLVAQGREEAEGVVLGAKQEIQNQVDSAKRKLVSEVSGIADGIVKSILRK